MTTTLSDLPLSAHTVALRQIQNLLNQPRTSIVSRMIAMGHIIDAAELSIELLDKKESIFEFAAIRNFITETDVAEYIASHLDDPLVHTLLKELYLISRPRETEAVKTGTEDTIHIILSNPEK